MTDREYCDILRLRALKAVERVRDGLTLRPDNQAGSMAAHVVIERLDKAANLAGELQVLAQAARVGS